MVRNSYVCGKKKFSPFQFYKIKRRLSPFFFVFIVVAPSLLYPSGYDIILQRNIFAPSKDASQQQTGEPQKKVLPVIKLSELDEVLELKGTFVILDTPEKSFAIMENKRTKEMDFHHIGDTVESALIKDIQENMVLFEYGFEMVELTRAGSRPVRVYPDAEYNITLVEWMERLKKEVIKPFPVTARPFIEDGSIMGFVIQDIPKDSILEKYGIKNNDVITRINTIPLDSPEKPLYAYENIMKYGIRRITLHVLRDNLPYIFLYNLH
jgi:type II secretory pathway component PulC